MINKNYNRFLQALIYLMLISAALHMIVLALHSFMMGTLVDFNFFKIIGIDLFYPEFVSSVGAYYSSFFLSCGIFISSYHFLAKTNKN